MPNHSGKQKEWTYIRLLRKKTIKICHARIVFATLGGLMCKKKMMNTKEEQFTAIIQKHERTIYTVCYMFSNNADEVDDLYQEILMRLWKGFDGFEGKSDIRTWIYRVSLNYCINFSNRKKREHERLDLSISTDTDHKMEKNLQVKQLYKRINALGLVDRSVILL